MLPSCCHGQWRENQREISRDDAEGSLRNRQGAQGREDDPHEEQKARGNGSKQIGM